MTTFNNDLIMMMTVVCEIVLAPQGSLSFFLSFSSADTPLLFPLPPYFHVSELGNQK